MSPKARNSLILKLLLLVIVLVIWALWMAPSACSVKIGDSAQGQCLELNPLDNLELQTGSGTIQIEVVDNIDKIIVKAVSGSRSFDSLKSTVKGDTLKVETVSNRKWWNLFQLGTSTRKMIVSIPSSIVLEDLTAVSGSGDIECNSIKVSEDINFKTASGRINAMTLTAKDISLVSASGRIFIDEALCDELNIANASGRCEIASITAKSLDVGSASGKVEVSDAKISKEANLASASGSLILNLLDVKDPSIKVKTSSGSIKVNNETTERQYTRSGNGPKIEMQSSSGSVSITY